MKNRKFKAQIIACLLACAALAMLSGCGKTDGSQAPGSSAQAAGDRAQETENSAGKTSAENPAGQGTDQADAVSGGNATAGDRILIAYFTAAENSGVDAVASASYTEINGDAVGRVRAVADMIHEQTGGELFSIQTSTVYPADGGALIDFAAEEQDGNVRPELTTHIENLDDYDVIFVGYPNWWYDMPMSMYSFFEEYDFSGKTIIPFNVHNGSRFSGTIDTIQELEPDATVVEDGFTVSEGSVADAESDVQTWLTELGYSRAE